MRKSRYTEEQIVMALIRSDHRVHSHQDDRSRAGPGAVSEPDPCELQGARTILNPGFTPTPSG